MRQCWNFLNVKDAPEQSDVIFILGGSSLAPVQRAYELYKKGFAPKIAFISTGGNFGGEKIWGVPENQKYRQVLLEFGVPFEDILTDGLTTNTLAEAQKAIPFLEKELGTKVLRMILVSRPVHQRRAHLTFRKQWPRVSYINCPANEEYTENDMETETRILQEMERIRIYSEKGDIEMPSQEFQLL